MKANRSTRTSQQWARPRWASVAFIFALGAAVASASELLELPSARATPMPQYLGGPSVRVILNDRVEFKWTADVAWRAYVEVFNNPDGTGPLIAKVDSVDGTGNPVIGTDHLVRLHLSLLPPDTTLFFRITMTDPTGTNPIPLMTPTPLPSFFTGAQSIGDVFVVADTDSAVISWQANVIGFGRVEYGTSSPGGVGSVSDLENIQNHSLELTGLLPGTTYQFRVSNHHAMDGDNLVEKTGSFTTALPITDAVLHQGRARPRVISPDQVSTLIVTVERDHQPVTNVPVRFEVLADSHGNGTLNDAAVADVLSNGEGRASVLFKGTQRGMVRIKASSPAARNTVTITVVVEGSLW